ncbi:MAG: DUF2442 domain-containing protein [Candidatus Promineifilaceae bacterium]
MAEIQTLKGIDIVVSDDTLTVELADGRTLSVPIAWYPRLLHGRQNAIIGNGLETGRGFIGPTWMKI